MMKIEEIVWKNLQGIRLENEILSVVLLPALGGKVASIYRRDKDFEMVAQCEKDAYQIPGFGADFSAYDASGLDDMFPNIFAAEVELHGKRYFYPDHGEIWSRPFQAEISANGVKLFCRSNLFDYEYEKIIYLQGERVCLKYDIHNRNDCPLPCIWTFHGLMRYEENMELLYGTDVQRFRNVFESQELGRVDEIYQRENSVYDFEKVPCSCSRTMVKYYAEDKIKDGFCGYRYPSHRLECRYHYDPEKLPYLGVWISAGGFRGDYNCALEPANGYYDDIRIAHKNQSLYYLRKEKPLQFTLELEVCEY